MAIRTWGAANLDIIDLMLVVLVEFVYFGVVFRDYLLLYETTK